MRESQPSIDFIEHACPERGLKDARSRGVESMQEVLIRTRGCRNCDEKVTRPGREACHSALKSLHQAGWHRHRLTGHEFLSALDDEPSDLDREVRITTRS
jgi:hypothetical protein